MNDLYTLTDAFDAVKRFVENSSCSTTVVYDRVTEACRRLLVKANWPYTVQTVRMRVNNGYFPLPRECSKIIAVNVCNEATQVNPMSYEFIASGPGELGSWAGTGIKGLMDAGMHPTMFDIPSIETIDEDAAELCTDRGAFSPSEGYQLAAFSPYIEDVKLNVQAAGLDKFNAQMNASATGFSELESFGINQWEEGVEGSIRGPLTTIRLSSRYYRQLTSWRKPATKGYISLYAINTENNYMYFLGKAHPSDTVPVWRRYKLSNFDCENGDCANIFAMCKMAPLKLTEGSDILPIQNLEAIKNMVIAIGFENTNDLNAAMSYEANAVRILNDQKAEHEGQGPVVSFVDSYPELAPMAGYNPWLI